MCADIHDGPEHDWLESKIRTQDCTRPRRQTIIRTGRSLEALLCSIDQIRVASIAHEAACARRAREVGPAAFAQPKDKIPLPETIRSHPSPPVAMRTRAYSEHHFITKLSQRVGR